MQKVRGTNARRRTPVLLATTTNLPPLPDAIRVPRLVVDELQPEPQTPPR